MATCVLLPILYICICNGGLCFLVPVLSSSLSGSESCTLFHSFACAAAAAYAKFNLFVAQSVVSARLRKPDWSAHDHVFIELHRAVLEARAAGLGVLCAYYYTST